MSLSPELCLAGKECNVEEKWLKMLVSLMQKCGGKDFLCVFYFFLGGGRLGSDPCIHPHIPQTGTKNSSMELAEI